MFASSSSVAIALLVVTLLPAQRVAWYRNGDRVGGYLGTALVNAGDIDGDGIADLLATEPGGSNGPDGRVHLFSGASGSSLRTFSPTLSNSGFGEDAAGLADCDGDGVRDIAISAYALGRLRIYSGATGAVLQDVGSVALGYGHALCDAGDVDGDGHGDVATTARTASGYGIAVISGRTGGVLVSPMGGLFSVSTIVIRVLGDIDHDGHAELLLWGGGAFVAILSLHPTPALRTIPRPAGSSGSFGQGGAGGADIDGDGNLELLVSDPGALFDGVHGGIFVIAPLTGLLLQSIPTYADEGPYVVRGVLGLGDLDADGRDDVLISATPAASRNVLQLAFGRDLRRIDYWSATPPFALGTEFPEQMAQLGDIDGDAIADFAVGERFDRAGRGQVVVISSRLLADVRTIGTGCGAGPFLPELGITRPILGRTAQIVGRDNPPAAPGLLCFSLRPHATTNLGVAGCDVAFDLGNWTTLALLPPAQGFAMPLPIPLVPQLAGIEIAFQTIHLPTSGPLGFDLSNGVWARLGF